MTRIGSLFSGYGGLDMAVVRALGGGEIVWHSDIKPASVTLLEARHPDVPNLGDMTAIDYAAAPPIDVLAASWPCQPHSSAGKRLGEADPRALWPHVARAVAATRPALFFGENVARITSNGELRRVVRSLAELGYVGAWRVLGASDVGAPHKRARCFVVAVDPVAPDTLRVGPQGRRTTGSAATGGRRPGHEDRAADRVTLLPTPRSSDGARGPNDASRAARDGGRSMPGEAVAIEAGRWGDYAAAIERWASLFDPAVPDPTMTSPRTKGSVLAPAFVEWMMGVPRGWVTGVPDLTRAQQISLLGDGVVPQQGEAAFRLLLDDLTRRLATGVAA